ncbi:hypothetical protein [Psychrosphaera haliotis]|uniref:Sulfotransferase domain-containing protein n=1 Tax=Psychrosphaera haliotis TaxID=555083 RepID=A0A6N8F3X2_9GAMM|nr:hypothetical protein [Psychrosphaera haliotis]MUH71366.1 hypothetical protein [Psychrosphaera haliotis]
MLKIYIHVGPGKSGSSAIQNWLSENYKQLLAQGIFYPVHSCDENGVSSGNVRALCTRDANNKYQVDERKLEKLIKQANKSNCSKLVLSSEAFFAQIEELAQRFPQAEFLFYIRNPLEIIESLYNQGIKRHYATCEFWLNKKITFGYTSAMRHLMEAHPSLNINYRFYGREFFEAGDIVVDFLSQIGANLDVTSVSKSINLSYSFEALEFKRQLNRLPNDSLHHRLDQFLQSFDGETKRFSLMTSGEFNRYKKATKIEMKSFLEFAGIEGTAFLEYIENYQQKTPVQQGYYQESVKKVIEELIEKQPGLFSQLVSVIENDVYLGVAESPFGQQILSYKRPLDKFKSKLKQVIFGKKRSSITASALTKEEARPIRASLGTPKNVGHAGFLVKLAELELSKGNYKQAYSYLLAAQKMSKHRQKVDKLLLVTSKKLMVEN